MSHFYTYGTKESNFETLKHEVSSIFEVEMIEHESGWWGIYALADHPSISELKLYPNYVESEEEYHNKDKSLKYLLSVAEPDDSVNFKALLENSPSGFKLIKHEEI